MTLTSVEVFKTNVQDLETAYQITHELSALFPNARCNFDLEDCDKILRIETNEMITQSVIKHIVARGYHCEVLE